MGTVGEFKCACCEEAVEKNATLMHTEREAQLWDLDCIMCSGCFKKFKGMLDKVKSQKSWTVWADLEQEADSLRNQLKSLKSELQFLRRGDPTCDKLLLNDPHNEVVTILANGCDPIKAHRSILMSRSEVFKAVLTSEEFKMRLQDMRSRNRGTIALTTPMHKDSFLAFIQFLYTAELKPEILKNHASELMTASVQYKIPILKSRCEDYIVNNVTPENAIAYLNVAHQCNSEAIYKAAVKQMYTNPKGIVGSNNYETMYKTNPEVFAGAFKYIILNETAASGQKIEPPPQVAIPVPDSSARSGLPGSSNSASRHGLISNSLGMCTCNVHPFAHSRYEFHGVHF
jgi:hypothetical protein